MSTAEFDGVARRKRPRVRAIVLLVLVLAGAGIVAGVASRNPSPAGFTATIYYVRQGLPGLISHSVSAVEVRVESITGPFYREDGIFSYSRVNATVIKRVAGAEVPDSFSFIANGDATKPFAGADQADALSGGFVPGDSYLVLLARTTPTSSDASSPTLILSGDFQTNWHIEGTQAVNAGGRNSGALLNVERIIRKSESLMEKPGPHLSS